jgi:antitoxin component YwqK of YwqJK toxin-antitoxin module
MKNLAALAGILIMILTVSCGGGTGESGAGKKAGHVPDTGFTGVRNYIKDNIKMKDVEFRNGVRQGLTRTYYKGGVIEQEIPYVDGKKNGEARWYYPDSKLFRVTPYVNDTIHGSQIQYYKSGRVKAKLDYVDGKRLPGIEEYNINGEKVTSYPEIKYKVNDRYDERGLYKIFVEMSDLSENVKYFRGDLVNGLVDMDSLKPMLQTATTGYLDLQKTPGQDADSIAVIASYLTQFGNRLYYRLAIPLPYKDLK